MACTASLLTLFSGITAPAALAQADELEIEEIIVTGSRLRMGPAESPNPISVVTGEEIARTAATSMEQFLAKLPAADFTGGASAGTVYGGGGASSIGLRNLGAQRTLVLVDGQRFIGTDFPFASSTTVDLNNIPISMIERVEVLRDGASSVYGADAIGGVINILLKKKLDGSKVDLSFGTTSRGDGTTYAGSVTTGIDLDRGSLILNAGADRRDPIKAKDRGWATNQHEDVPTTGLYNVSYVPFGTIAYTPDGTVYYYNASAPPHDAYDTAFFLANKDKLPAGLIFNDAAWCNPCQDFSQLPYLTGKLERKQVNAIGNYNLTEDVSVKFRGLYTRRDSEEVYSPAILGYYSATPKFPYGVYVPATLPNGSANPYNPYGDDVSFDSRLPMEYRRGYKDKIDTYQAALSFEGTVWDKYNWELGGAYGLSKSAYSTPGMIDFRKASQVAGMEACSTADTAAGCSLGNFLGYNQLTAQQIDYFTYTERNSSEISHHYFHGNINGPVAALPAGDLNMGAGFEFRTEKGKVDPDPVVQAGDGERYTSPSSGSYDVSSAYVEAMVPLLKDQPLAEALTLAASGRFDHYSAFGDAWTWKLGLDHRINDSFRLRGARSTGFLAPQIKQLYGGVFLDVKYLDDPCANGGAYADQGVCASTLAALGVASSEDVEQFGSLAVLRGGNPDLKPEKSGEWSGGFVLTPEAVPGLAVTTDYYRVKIRELISEQDLGGILEACYGQGDPGACAKITRVQGTGQVLNVQSVLINAGRRITSGIDVGVEYFFDIDDIGRVALSGEAKYTIEDKRTNVSGETVDYVGTFLIDDAAPKWKGKLGAVLTRDDWSVGWSTRYYGKVHCAPNNCYVAPDYFGDHAPSVFYHDLSATYAWNGLDLSAGVENVFDKDPPYVVGGAQINTLTSAGYDLIGRYFYLKASYSF
ncbi:TonB-dependent receptor [Niveispirillum sp. KHB5.9]|uniref:TonB-dependent receptor n=1 Tax=Niveispirillum sp. KHB5.9 TaxID=3400269 RepID=UPI003A87A58C